MGGGPETDGWVVFVSEMQMGEGELVTVLTVEVWGTESSSVSLSSVSKQKSAMGGVSGEVGCVTSEMGE